MCFEIGRALCQMTLLQCYSELTLQALQLGVVTGSCASLHKPKMHELDDIHDPSRIHVVQEHRTLC